MGKFSKRLKKLNKNYRNILVIGSAFGNLVEMLEEAPTVFILYPKDETLRYKNLIYRENLESVNHLPDVDFVIIDREYVHTLPNILFLLRARFPQILIEGEPMSSIEQHKFLKSHGYKVVDIHNTHHLWKN